MTKVVLKDVRLAFAQIWEAKAFEEGKPPRFNASFLFPPDHPAKAIVQKAIQEVAAEKWQGKAAAVLQSLKGNPNKFCFHNGDSKEAYEGFPGNLYIRAGNKVRPTIKDRDGQTPLTQADGRPYSGCYVNAILEIWAQDNKWGKGVQCDLLGIQFVRDGDAFSGGGVASEGDFEDLSDGADAPAMGAMEVGGDALV
jgi:ssDNA-binding protein